MVFKPVHVFSYICYLIWPRREDHHGIRCIFASRITYIIDCIRTSALILRWRRSVYLLGSALTFFWPLVMWTIITLFYCTVCFRSENIYIYIYIFIWTDFVIFEMISNRTYFYEIIPVTVCSRSVVYYNYYSLGYCSSIHVFCCFSFLSDL